MVIILPYFVPKAVSSLIFFTGKGILNKINLLFLRGGQL